MSNLISRSALLEEFKKCHISFNGTPMEKSDMMISYRSLARVINKQQTVEAKPEWIPCGERMPEDETLLYWTTHEDGSLILHGYKKTNGFIYNWEVDDLEKRKRQGQVIAWMPIFEPRPYNADMRKKVE